MAHPPQPQHQCCCFSISSHLDTSEDFSAELDRSHGFLTASGGGAEKQSSGGQILSPPVPQSSRPVRVLYLWSSAGLGRQSRPARQRYTSAHNSPKPHRPHTLQDLRGLTSSGFSDAFRLRRTNRWFRMANNIYQKRNQGEQAENKERVQEEFGMLPVATDLRASKAFISCISPSPPPPLPPLDLLESLLLPDPGGLLSS